MNIGLSITLLVILGTLSFFFSGVENVYVTVNKLRLEKDVKEGKPMSKQVYRMATNFNNTLSTLLLGNALVNPAITTIGTLLALDVARNTNWSEAQATTLSVVIIFIVILIFFEIIPKTLCLKFNYRLSYIFIYPMLFFKYLFLPINFVMDKFLNLMMRFFSLFARPKREIQNRLGYSDDELTEMVNEIEESGVIDEKTSELLKSAIEFTETEAYEIMTPRVDVFAYDIDDDIEELMNDSDIFKYSRVPVYEDTIDNVIGILPTKLLLRLILSKKKVKVKELMQPALFVHHSKQISTLLKEFKATKNHIAIVIDEYGGTEGIITMEDIVEEIIGEIWDESDEVNEPYVEVASGHFIIDGGLNLDDFFELLDIAEDEETDYDTVGGWCLDKLDRFARVGDTFEYQGYQILVTKVEEFTVEKIEAKKIIEEE
ncbi:MAG TPA: hemolysin family protein [Bacilli bacterium]|nr:hemolysin family protein [Bacilli bacterium]